MKKSACVFAFALVYVLVIAMLQISPARAQETLIWEGDVPSRGDSVSSPMLTAGQGYRIAVRGAFIGSTSLYGVVEYAADAQYYSQYPSNWWIWDSHLPAPDGHSFLQINGMDVNWGPFSNGQIDWYGHEYSTPYTGTGASITFAIVDWIDHTYTTGTGQNWCHIHVWIYEGPPPPPPEGTGHTPGYWRHQFNAYIDDKGSPQETWANLVLWTGMIDTASRTLPTPWGLPSLAQIDYNHDGTFTTGDAHNIFNDRDWNHLWTPLANWYNWAAGLGPVD